MVLSMEKREKTFPGLCLFVVNCINHSFNIFIQVGITQKKTLVFNNLVLIKKLMKWLKAIVPKCFYILFCFFCNNNGFFNLNLRKLINLFIWLCF